MGNGHLYGDEEKQNKPRDLSSDLSSASNKFCELEQVSLLRWTWISLPVERNGQT